MFNNLLGFWKGKHFLDEVYGEFKEMLDGAEAMFRMVCSLLLDGVGEGDLKQKVRDADKAVNELEKQIRTRIVEHLALQPSVDVNTCLILMSVVKDGERLGDYCKNLCEVAELLTEPVDKTHFREYFGELDTDIIDLFARTKSAFLDADEQQARGAWEVENRLAKFCDSIIDRLAVARLSTNRAVCYALIARHFKRMVAHLANIATATILPLSDIDYFDEQRS